MSRVTQADVVRTAIQQLSKTGGYTPETYFAPKPGGAHDGRPGAHVGATCAIGGVEQAIWQLTGEVVHDDPMAGVRERLAQRPEPALSGSETPRQKLYAGVMRKLNRKARALFPDLDEGMISTVEEVTYVGDEDESLGRTLQVFNAVLADLEKPKAAQLDANRDPGDETAEELA